jgi:hypothetical protein
MRDAPLPTPDPRARSAAVSAVCLSPATLSARNHLTSELLRTLSRMAQPWWVRASTPSYRRFTLPMARSPRFGSTACDSQHPPQGGHGALFGLAFATATRHRLTSPHTITRRLILQKARHHGDHQPKTSGQDALTACRHTVSGTLSRPLTGALFTFPSRYWSAIGHQEVFSLTTWSWQIHTGFHGPRATREHTQKTSRFRLPDSHRLRSAIPNHSTITTFYNSLPARQH